MCDGSCSTTANGPVPIALPCTVLEIKVRLKMVSGRTDSDSMTMAPSCTWAFNPEEVSDAMMSPIPTGEPSLNRASGRIQARTDFPSRRSHREANAGFTVPSASRRSSPSKTQSCARVLYEPIGAGLRGANSPEAAMRSRKLPASPVREHPARTINRSRRRKAAPTLQARPWPSRTARLSDHVGAGKRLARALPAAAANLHMLLLGNAALGRV